MKPFNLKMALAGYPVVTRDGTPATDFILFDKAGGTRKLVCMVRNTIMTYHTDGTLYGRGSILGPSQLDLFMKSRVVTKYGYRFILGSMHPSLFDTEELAKQKFAGFTGKIVKVQWEE